ncbi:MAG: hypothetical protein KDA85_05435, partial [Planctomycetaceae bacterium]|nr:hypothetical protein [Planctomycetaceae bacterium]
DDESPLMTHIRLNNVLMPASRKMQFHSKVHPLAGTVSDDAVYSLLSHSQGDCLLLSIDLERSDLAFRTAFPILVANALNWFAGQPDDVTSSISAGQTISHAMVGFGDAAGSEAPEILIAPSGRTTPVHGRQSGPFNEVGVWRITAANATRSGSLAADVAMAEPADDLDEDIVLQEIAVNLASDSETDLRPVAADSVGNDAQVVGADWFTRPVWFYLIVAACLFCTFEWFLYQRRLIG